jgi:hypothetical protein
VTERIPAEDWQQHTDHTERYAYAGRMVLPGETVNDIACGVGYGATYLAHAGAYRGFDKPGIPRADLFPGTFCGADLNDPDWEPPPADVTVCFETLEHVLDARHLAAVIAMTTRRAIVLSVPLYPHAENPFHLVTFTKDEVPPMFPAFTVTQDWAQPEARGHVWLLTRDPAG